MGGVTTKVDPAAVKSAGGQVRQAVSPLQQASDAMSARTATQAGFATAADVTTLCTAWTTSLGKAAAAFGSIATAIENCGTVYELHEGQLTRSFE